ncbi:TonB-dependent siderophore receptor [Microbulbifer sp. Q7]|uniref:TonB-dependent receptor plug domain-containing protein n=1 Tax=Microbulbifer sp. Q7 TaxID=1785091 RepID=UPI000834ED09|nr:TonB-dependent receptor [Microbulbifer sp. Q7]
MNKILLSCAVASAVSGPAFANSSTNSTNSESAIPDLETIIVVSARQGEPLRRVATSVTVLDEADIKARGLASLADVLRSAPSVSVSNSGGMGRATALRVRGEDGFRTLVRIDGVEISDPTGTQGGAPIQHILSNGLARVELLRGPQGMLYGADAGGVLDISTRRDDTGHRIDIGAEGGSFDTRRYNASAGGAAGALDYFVTASKAHTRGFNTSTFDTQLQDDDGYNNTTLHGRAGWNVSEEWRAEAIVRDTKASGEFDRCGWPVTQDACTEDFRQQNTRVSLARDSEGGQQTLSYSRADLSRTNYAAGAVSYDTEGDIQTLNLNGFADLAESQAFIYGLERREDTVRDLNRDRWAAYSEYQGAYAEQVFFTLGLRHDDNSDFGGHNSFRASTAYLVDPFAHGSLKLKASYGTGFRAPSLFEINYNRSQNNPDLPLLTPEESRGVEWGIEYFGDNALHLEFVQFDQIIENEIGFDLVDYTGYLQSGGRSRSRGVELIANAQLSDTLRVSANYTYTDTQNTGDTPRARRPKQLANLGVSYQPSSALSMALNIRSSADAVDIDGSTMDDYQVLDASLRYRVSAATTVYLRGENLTDKAYYEVPGYNTAGAAGYAGVEFTF